MESNEPDVFAALMKAGRIKKDGGKLVEMSPEAAKAEFVDRVMGTVDPGPDIRWGINVLLEKIAEKFEGWDTYDIWRSDAAMVVRSFKNDATAPEQWQPIETAPKDQEVEVRGIWKLRGDGVQFTHWRARS